MSPQSARQQSWGFPNAGSQCPPAAALRRKQPRVSKDKSYASDGSSSSSPWSQPFSRSYAVYFADFPWVSCSIDQSLFSSESGCGSRYGPSVREETPGAHAAEATHVPKEP